MKTKMSKWEQEARCRLIRMGKDHGGIQEWIHEWFGVKKDEELLYVMCCDGTPLQLQTQGIYGTRLYNCNELVGGWGIWLQDELRAG